MGGRKQLTRDDILRGLDQINAYLVEKEVIGEICIYGGACMCLAFSARISTKDVDAVFAPAKELRKAIFEVGTANGWDWNWVNDDVAGFLSDSKNELVEVNELSEFSNLKVQFPKAEYLLAMKCLAARAGHDDEPSTDLADAIWLCGHLDISKREQVDEILTLYYPENPLSTETDFFIEELITQLAKS